MLRNKEYRILLVHILCVSIIFGIVTCFINPMAGGILIASDSFIMLLCIRFSRSRYQDIEQLSSYLRKIYGGDYALDIRDNMEGELSILKNEIYKVTLILSNQAEQLKSEKQQLADALSDISHQLKTPLTSMMVMADLLKKDDLEIQKRKEFTKSLESQLGRMEWLLTSLLKLSKIDAGAIQFKQEPILISELIDHALKPLLIPIEIKNLVLRIEGDPATLFYGDLYWSVEALINIIKNCIEHTQKEGELQIHYLDNPICCQITISDNGVGIDKEDIPHVFKRFYKGKNAGEESVGIGLAMAKSIITNQNGTIIINHHKRQGTEFIIKFYKQTL